MGVFEGGEFRKEGWAPERKLDFLSVRSQLVDLVLDLVSPEELVAGEVLYAVEGGDELEDSGAADVGEVGLGGGEGLGDADF